MKSVYGICMQEDVKINAQVDVMTNVKLTRFSRRALEWIAFVMIARHIGMEAVTQGINIKLTLQFKIL